MEPIVSIELKEYNRLKDLENQFKFLTDYVEIHIEQERNTLDPLAVKSLKCGVISKKKLDYFYKNLLDIDKLIVKE
jgi:hypothetical protein